MRQEVIPAKERLLSMVRGKAKLLEVVNLNGLYWDAENQEVVKTESHILEPREPQPGEDVTKYPSLSTFKKLHRYPQLVILRLPPRGDGD